MPSNGNIRILVFGICMLWPSWSYRIESIPTQLHDIAEGQVVHDICLVLEIANSMPSGDHTEFLTKFIASTRRRLERVERAIDSPEHADGGSLAMDIHLIWGEAALLNLPKIAQIARETETAARRLEAQDTAEARTACVAAIRAMRERLDLEEGRRTARPGSEYTTESHPCRVLVVDDSEFSARALSRVFERSGIEARTATTMSEVLDLCATFRPSILVSDVHMPGLDLPELCSRFRTATQSRRTGIILVSAHSDAELQDSLRVTGADDFVPKCAGASAVVERVLALAKDISG